MLWTITIHYAVDGEIREPKVFAGPELADVKAAVFDWEREQEVEHGEAYRFRGAFVVRADEAARCAS